MPDRIREQYVERIVQMEQEAERSGKPHRRDLYRAIKRMRGELKQYDAYRAQAARKKG